MTSSTPPRRIGSVSEASSSRRRRPVREMGSPRWLPAASASSRSSMSALRALEYWTMRVATYAAHTTETITARPLREDLGRAPRPLDEALMTTAFVRARGSVSPSCEGSGSRAKRPITWPRPGDRSWGRRRRSSRRRQLRRRRRLFPRRLLQPAAREGRTGEMVSPGRTLPCRGIAVLIGSPRASRCRILQAFDLGKRDAPWRL